MFFSKYIEPFYFIVTFAFVIFLSYIFIYTPKIMFYYTKIVIKYPTPQNAGKITYIDDGGVCYRYKALEVECPKDKNIIKNIPLQ